jgi:hypothetical protein
MSPRAFYINNTQRRSVRRMIRVIPGGLRIQEAAKGVTLAQLQQQRSQVQSDHYEGLLDEGLIGLEQAAIGFLEGAVVLQVGAAALMGAQAVHDWLKSSFTAGLLGGYHPIRPW